MTTQLNNESIKIETLKSKLCPYNNQYGNKYETKIDINITIDSSILLSESNNSKKNSHNKAIDFLIKIIENYRI